MNNSVLKKIASLCLLAFTAASIYAAEKISDTALAEIDNFMMMRMELASCRSPQEALEKISARSDSLADTAKTAPFTAEENLILENLVVLEKYNYMRDADRYDTSIKTLILAQKNKNDEYFKNNKNAHHNKWMYCTAADVTSCSMPYLSIGAIMRDGMSVKKYYEEALKQDAALSYALMNLAQWHYYAPAISGGSKKKARQYFSDALSNARNSAEKYYSEIFLSQCSFDEKKYDEATSYLNMADARVPGGSYIKKIRAMNESGHSMFYYNKHQDELDREK